MYPNAIEQTVMTRPRMKAFIPAPGGAFVSSPNARTATDRIAVPVNSVKNAVPASIQLYLGNVMKLLNVPLFPKLALPYSIISFWKSPNAMRAAIKAPRICANTYMGILRSGKPRNM